MEKGIKIRPENSPFPSTDELRGRQSVRATFRLSEKAIDALSIVSFHLGIKQKSLFDHLIEGLELGLVDVGKPIEKPLKPSDRVQKTYVLSRKTICCLERASKAFGLPRDILVECSIQRLLPLIEKERERHRNRKRLLEMLSDYRMEGEKILEESRELVGEDDPVHQKLSSSLNALFNLCDQIESFVERGSVIEDF